MNLYRIIDKIKDFPRDLKHLYQRAKKGYSYRDLWSIDYWFMKIMPKMLTDFKKNLHGCPAQFTTHEDETERNKPLSYLVPTGQQVCGGIIFYQY